MLIPVRSKEFRPNGGVGEFYGCGTARNLGGGARSPLAKLGKNVGSKPTNSGIWENNGGRAHPRTSQWDGEWLRIMPLLFGDRSDFRLLRIRMGGTFRDRSGDIRDISTLLWH